ncbi:hypothetical protein ECG_08387 [Echinococcus granulosus]|nr:hypothetical protein ECG_08387 [Echinococcus granulosus]
MTLWGGSALGRVALGSLGCTPKEEVILVVFYLHLGHLLSKEIQRSSALWVFPTRQRQKVGPCYYGSYALKIYPASSMRNLDLAFDKVHSGYDNFEGRLSFYPGDYASCCECGRSAQPELSDKWLRPNTVSSLPLLRQIPSALNVKFRVERRWMVRLCADRLSDTPDHFLSEKSLAYNYCLPLYPVP